MPETHYRNLADNQAKRFCEQLDGDSIKCQECKKKIDTLMNNYQYIIDSLISKQEVWKQQAYK